MFFRCSVCSPPPLAEPRQTQTPDSRAEAGEEIPPKRPSVEDPKAVGEQPEPNSLYVSPQIFRFTSSLKCFLFPLQRLILFLSCYCQCCSWSHCSLQYVPGDWNHHPVSRTSEHGLPWVELPRHHGGAVTDLSDTHHGQYTHRPAAAGHSARLSERLTYVAGDAAWRSVGPGGHRQMGGGAGQLLPLPVERQRWSRGTNRRPVVQPERGERPALRLHAHVQVRQGGRREGVRGGEVDHEEGEVPRSHVSQWAGLRSKGEAALPHLQGVQRWRCPQRPTVSISEPGTAPAHQEPLTLSLSLSVSHFTRHCRQPF